MPAGSANSTRRRRSRSICTCRSATGFAIYCGCNTSVVRLDSSRRAYAALLEREIALVAAFIGRRARVAHIHWGGGTPTSLPGDRSRRIMAQIRALFAVDADAEVAIELDPTTPSRGSARGARRDGRHPHQPRRAGPRSRGAKSDRSHGSPTSRRRLAPKAARALGVALAQPRSHLRPAPADRGQRRARPRGARSISAPTASRCSATRMCRG